MKSSSFRLYLVDFLCVLLFSLGSALIVFPWLGHSGADPSLAACRPIGDGRFIPDHRGLVYRPH